MENHSNTLFWKKALQMSRRRSDLMMSHPEEKELLWSLKRETERLHSVIIHEFITTIDTHKKQEQATLKF